MRSMSGHLLDFGLTPFRLAGDPSPARGGPAEALQMQLAPLELAPLQSSEDARAAAAAAHGSRNGSAGPEPRRGGHAVSVLRPRPEMSPAESALQLAEPTRSSSISRASSTSSSLAPEFPPQPRGIP